MTSGPRTMIMDGGAGVSSEALALALAPSVNPRVIVTATTSPRARQRPGPTARTIGLRTRGTGRIILKRH
jgi:hypothetical protein